VSLEESSSSLSPTPEETPSAGSIVSPSGSPPPAKPAKRARQESETGSTGSVASDGQPRKKRGRKSKAVTAEMMDAKRVKLTSLANSRGFGYVLTVGQGDTGQLGLGEDIMEKTRPGLVKEVEDAVEVVAGGMHTVVLNKKGEVWTFGCNDEGSLGRIVVEEEECFVPGKVTLASTVVQISAGDSHTAALTQEGWVFLWGTFRDSSGPIGLVQWGKMEMVPVQVKLDEEVVKIISGGDHLVMLSRDGNIYTMGNSEQGQLGRVPEMFGHRGGRRGGQLLLQPDKIHAKSKSRVFKDVWAGSYNTVAMTMDGELLVMGLNNYSQMGLDHNTAGLTFFMPVLSKNLSKKDWKQISVGQHHALGLDREGGVFCLGRSEYGRLGLGEGVGDAGEATAVQGVGAGCKVVACGTAVSYALGSDGSCYSWGMGTNGQLGTGQEDDVWEPSLMKSKQLEGREVLTVSSGGQHTVMIVRDRK